MNGISTNQQQYEITNTYDLCVRAFRTTRKLLKLNIKLHDDSEQPCQQILQQGDIFLFNHFARFETFIPQYLIHTETGAYCRSIAAPEIFNDERFSHFLKSIGVVPNNKPDLFPFIAKEILHGRKLVIFPEGGMVKNKRVVDERGKFGIYSRTSMEIRKHHRGAAVIALAIDAFKTALLRDYSKGNYSQVERWTEQLEFEDSESLLIKALKPTIIVPSHITFYPIRVNDNMLLQAARLFNKGINKRFAEELLIEGNLLFRHTDMDIHLSKPLIVGKYWKWWEKMLLPNVVHRFQSMQELFNLTPEPGHWTGHIHSLGMQAKSNLVRDDYMKAMYESVSINLSHIASFIILRYYSSGIKTILCSELHKTLYVCIKAIQKCDAHLHRSLQNPQEYGVVIEGGSSRLEQFLETTQKMELIQRVINTGEDDYYRFHDKIMDDFDFDEVRTENLIRVYANELAPLKKVTQQLIKTFTSINSITPQQIADFRYDDQLLAYEWDKKQFDKPRFAAINQLQTANRDANWFRFISSHKNSHGVVLVHGFLASPAEMFELGKKLQQSGYSVMGVRLKGHGTSPWDLRDRDWQEWAASVKRGFDILKVYCADIHLVGFSTGGLLALNQAIQHPHKQLASVISVTAPVEFKSKQMKFVPLLHQANKLVRWVSSEGLIPFRPNESEHPEVNYAHIPIRALYQLQKLIEKLMNTPAVIHCPVTLMQADNDPVVEVDSVEKLFRHIDADDITIEMIQSQKHGILYEDIDQTQQKIINLIELHSLAQTELDTEGQPEEC